ncbi:alpha/beta hydrolase [Thiotrichales bacterium 19S11-10]|nr:alpha/beta hydrolase [Thiotrichales bacterium 19S11-10]
MKDQINKINCHAVFLPGWHFKSSIFSNIAKHFSSYQLIDYPIGIDQSISFESMTKLINSHIKLKNIEQKKVLIAWSLGGLFSIALGNNDINQFDEMVLLGASPYFSENKSDNWQGINQIQQNKFYYLLKNRPNDLLKRFIKLIAYPFENENLSDFLYAHIDQRERINWERLLDFLFQVDLRDQLQKIKMPTLFVSGNKDAITTSNDKNFERINKYIKSIVIGNEGHIPFVTNEVSIMQQIQEFLNV